MRFDASVSLRPRGEEQLFPRAEIKNLNSFRSLKNAVAYEISRQTALWEAGEIPQKEMTVGWLDDEQKTVFMRWKESADDYRYFDEPDLPPLKVDASRLDRIRPSVPELPHLRRARYMKDFGLDRAVAMTLADPGLAAYFEAAASRAKDAKLVSNWIAGTLAGKLNETGEGMESLKIDPAGIGALADLVSAGNVSTTTAKEVLVADEVWSGEIAPAAYIERHGLLIVQDEGAIEDACRKAIEANPKAAADVKAGQEKALGVLMGAVMKETKGKAPTAKVQEILKKLLAQ